jgi:hypothetical protein
MNNIMSGQANTSGTTMRVPTGTPANASATTKIASASA